MLESGNNSKNMGMELMFSLMETNTKANMLMDFQTVMENTFGQMVPTIKATSK